MEFFSAFEFFQLNNEDLVEKDLTFLAFNFLKCFSFILTYLNNLSFYHLFNTAVLLEQNVGDAFLGSVSEGSIFAEP